jgi:hypothetical protein
VATLIAGSIVRRFCIDRTVLLSCISAEAIETYMVSQYHD